MSGLDEGRYLGGPATLLWQLEVGGGASPYQIVAVGANFPVRQVVWEDWLVLGWGWWCCRPLLGISCLLGGSRAREG